MLHWLLDWCAACLFSGTTRTSPWPCPGTWFPTPETCPEWTPWARTASSSPASTRPPESSNAGHHKDFFRWFFFKFPWKQFLPIWKVALNVEFHLRMLLLVLEKLCIGHDCEVMIIYRKHAFKSFLCEELILVQSKFAEMSVSFSV